jgi:hypothetical protein
MAGFRLASITKVATQTASGATPEAGLISGIVRAIAGRLTARITEEIRAHWLKKREDTSTSD